MRLSPLNFRGLLHTLNVVGEPLGGPAPESPSAPKHRRRAIECWKCPECDEVYEWEDEAEECCAEAAAQEAPFSTACPVCAKSYETHRDASDCCLWKDLDTHTRWAVADAVQAGSTWIEALKLPRPN
jgi:hypothetical protein